ncbi:MAG TPA: helix-hairpin-helix domain-containing protein [Bdellovibrionota bacterium]|nr:helix-hairpin-helix domain-containing protein [Bdellovibrionota bacterium]
MNKPILRVLIVGSAIVIAQACAGPEKKKQAPNTSSPPSSVIEQQPGAAPVLGSQSSEPGTAEIQRQRQVIVTEKTEVPTLKTTSTKADLNRIGSEHLIALGVSPELADSIVRHREEHGDFKSISELLEVDGMNTNVYRSLSRKVGVSRTG